MYTGVKVYDVLEDCLDPDTATIAWMNTNQIIESMKQPLI